MVQAKVSRSPIAKYQKESLSCSQQKAFQSDYDSIHGHNKNIFLILTRIVYAFVTNGFTASLKFTNNRSTSTQVFLQAFIINRLYFFCIPLWRCPRKN